MKTLLTVATLAVILFGTMYIMSPEAALRMAHQLAQLPNMISVWLASFGL